MEKANFCKIHLSQKWRSFGWMGMIVGVSLFIVAQGAGQGARAWGAVLMNAMIFFSLCLGGSLFGNMQDLVGAQWSVGIRRLHQSFACFLPWVGSFLALFALAAWGHWGQAHEVYSWISKPEILHHFPGKKDWLVPGFFVLRIWIALGILLFIAHYQLRKGVEKDLALAASSPLASELSQEAAIFAKTYSAPILVISALAFTSLTFDLTMSLAPTWFSTLWAGWSFSVLMQMFLAFLLLTMHLLKSSSLGPQLSRQAFHDVGKLLFGFTAFYAYLTYAHVLTYWYTNIPEETSYFLARLEKPWVDILVLAPFLSFLIPFISLIPKASKWTFSVAVPVCILVLLSQWLNYLLVVMPEVVPYGLSFGPWLEVGIFWGFLGGFLLVWGHFISHNPLWVLEKNG